MISLSLVKPLLSESLLPSVITFAAMTHFYRFEMLYIGVVSWQNF